MTKHTEIERTTEHGFPVVYRKTIAVEGAYAFVRYTRNGVVTRSSSFPATAEQLSAYVDVATAVALAV